MFKLKVTELARLKSGHTVLVRVLNVHPFFNPRVTPWRPSGISLRFPHHNTRYAHSVYATAHEMNVSCLLFSERGHICLGLRWCTCFLDFLE